MTDYNLYRGSIFHCIEDSSNVKPVYFPDGLMVVREGRIVEVVNTLSSLLGLALEIL